MGNILTCGDGGADKLAELEKQIEEQREREQEFLYKKKCLEEELNRYKTKLTEISPTKSTKVDVQ